MGLILFGNCRSSHEYVCTSKAVGERETPLKHSIVSSFDGNWSTFKWSA